MKTSISQEGKSFPLGATLVPGGANFSVFAKHSTAAQLLLFDDVDAPGLLGSSISIRGPTAPTITGMSLYQALSRVKPTPIASPDLSIPREGCVSIPTRYCSTLMASALPGRQDAAGRPPGIGGTMPLRR
jgi:hypothetical protein